MAKIQVNQEIKKRPYKLTYVLNEHLVQIEVEPPHSNPRSDTPLTTYPEVWKT